MSTARRRVLVAISALVLMVLSTAFVGWMAQSNELYWAQSRVVFIPPSTNGDQNVLSGDYDSLVHFASMIERELNGAAQDPRLSSSDTTLFGQGVRRGVSVTLPDTGGQWQRSYSQAALEIQVVGATRHEVVAAMQKAVGTVVDTAQRRQSERGILESRRIQTAVVPQNPYVFYEGVSRGRGVIALTLAVTGVVWLVILALNRGRQGTIAMRFSEVHGAGALARRESERGRRSKLHLVRSWRRRLGDVRVQPESAEVKEDSGLITDFGARGSTELAADGQEDLRTSGRERRSEGGAK